ncbi:unnamed protein product [Adineta ricciae]|uniref:PIPK domain-containing protein n=1 Tax=Adineta ricciae TaxID=249248 RepID=A0A814LP35_ADIRI|nr:unnamed protein product [Adineta ricciae]
MDNNHDYVNTSTSKIVEGLYSYDYWNPLNSHIASYIKSPIQLSYISSKTSIISRSLRHAIVDLLDHILREPNDYEENDTTVIGTEHRVHHTRRYTFKANQNERQNSEGLSTDKIELDISSLAPTVFYQIREDIGISNRTFRQSFSEHHFKDFTNPGKSGSLMYKTFDELFILKTLREYEARLLMQILGGYHLQLNQRPTILNRYVGLYSIRFPTSIQPIETYIAIMVNAFTPSLQVNEIFDLKGSTMKRKIAGLLSVDKLHQLKDLDFTDLYPGGIRIPSSIYHRLHLVISNDVKVLKKLQITDFSLILGIRHLDMTNDDLIQQRPAAGIGALLHMSQRLALMPIIKHRLFSLPSISLNDPTTSPVSYLKPLEMLGDKLDTSVYYNNDRIASVSLPIPGVVNRNNQRVCLYLAIIDILQTYDCMKSMEHLLKTITDPNRRRQYSVVDPNEYERRIMKFLFETVFINAGDSFPWPIMDINTSVADNESTEPQEDNKTIQNQTSTGNNKSTAQRLNSTLSNIWRFRF